MAALIDALQLVLPVALPIAGFIVARRRPHHTRRQLIASAALGGGLAGAITAAFATASGASSADVWPFAGLDLVTGATIGLLGVAALAFGAWLNHDP